MKFEGVAVCQVPGRTEEGWEEMPGQAGLDGAVFDSHMNLHRFVCGPHQAPSHSQFLPHMTQGKMTLALAAGHPRPPTVASSMATGSPGSPPRALPPQSPSPLLRLWRPAPWREAWSPEASKNTLKKIRQPQQACQTAGQQVLKFLSQVTSHKFQVNLSPLGGGFNLSPLGEV